MKLSPAFLIEATGCAEGRAEEFADPIGEAADLYNINTALRLAAFLAHTGHESGGFSRLVESLNYTPEALMSVFGSKRITREQAERYGRMPAHHANQEAIANIVYGGAWGIQQLGNIRPGDGWMYRGYGLIQRTGRANCRHFTTRLRALLGADVPDFEAFPELQTLPRWAALSAGDFWDMKHLNSLADNPGEFEQITRRINTALQGLTDRVARWYMAQTAIAQFGLFTLNG